MVAFDHRDPGTDPAEWSSHLDSLGLPEWTTWADASGIVVVSPHPDDETLAVGGLMARAARAGVPVTVLLLTMGENSHPDSPTHTPDDLRTRRATEVRRALAALGPAIVLDELGLVDSGTGAASATVETAISRAVAASGDRPLIVAPWRGDGHHDHRIAGEAAARVALATRTALAEYPIWMWHWATSETGDIPWATAVQVRLQDLDRAGKTAAVDAYGSQTEPLSPAVGDEAIVDARHLGHFSREAEVLFLTAETDAHPSSRTRESFDEFYERRPGGWDFSSWYERRKRAVLLSALPRERFRRVLEVGCATGELAAALTGRGDEVLGIDIAEAPLRRARQVAPAASFERMTVPEEWPQGTFDLVVLSEVGYYLSADDLERTIDRILASLDDDGVLVACHWRHPDSDAVTDAAIVHERISERWTGRRSVRHEEDDILLDVFVRSHAPSVAADAGLAG